MSTYAPGLTPSQVNASQSAQWRQIIRQEINDVRCATVAFLTENVTDSQTVTVQIAIQERVRPASGAYEWWDVPPITNVPIIVPRGGGYSITLPFKKGDQGVLIFCDTCFDNWWTSGQSNAPPAANVTTPSGSQTQLEVRRHHVHDCGFLPGVWSQNNLLSNYSTDTLQIRSDDGATIIDVAESGVTVTGETVTLNSPESAAGALVVGTTLELPGVTLPTVENPSFYLPVKINGVIYKLLLGT